MPLDQDFAEKRTAMSPRCRALWILPLVLAASTLRAEHVVAADAERAAIDVAHARVEPPDRFEVLSVRFGGADPVAAEHRD